ncbi:MAG: C10 family peptidase [Bacteroidota bacterium]|nr:C10 family peptidase [Bacteroidota bacterium]
MKKLLLTLGLFLSILFSFAKPIDALTAKLIGQNFLTTRTNNASFKSGVTIDLAYTAMSAAQSESAKLTPANYFYVFNVTQGNGFVIVSADDQALPILGYSDEVKFNATNIPNNVQKWLEAYKNEIRFIIENNLVQTEEMRQEWNALLSAKPAENLAKKATVNPLVQTKWNQAPYENALCPYDNVAAERTVSGCVATAMAQIMKYWNYPAKGTGNHSYNHSKYGTLSANFGSTTYNWSGMPNVLNSSNTAVATLMYHCGVGVEMQYDVAANGGSGAYVITSGSPITHCSEYALKTYFGYKSSLQGVKRSSYTQTQWIALMKSELDASRPILHDGFGTGGGHAFVCDGYDNNSFFHFNWGWGGSSDGYFSVNALNPGSLGAGGGAGGFNSGQEIIIGVEPPTSTSTYDMRLYSAISVNPSPVSYGAGFSVTANFANFGANAAANFSGDFAAAVFNSSDQFVDYVEVKTGFSLAFNSYYTNPLVFTSTGLASLIPGTYKVGMYYKPTGSQNWVAFANGSFQNFKEFTVAGNNQNPLRLYAAITTSPSTITRSQTFSVNFNVANFGTNTFNGEISVDIHRSNGDWIRELQSKTGLTLPSNSQFTNGLTYTFDGGIEDSAGTYLFFVWNKPTGGDWTVLGNGTFSNPISVQVKDPSLTPDMYEVNNTMATAFNLPLVFAGNTASKNTLGSNIHLGNDYDYYKIILPTGYNYTINSRLHDSYNSGNSQTYTVDALLSYSTDGTTWSDAFDDIITSPIVLNGGGTVYFKVAPYFTGSIGTYLLETSVSRTSPLSAEKNITGFITSGLVGSANINAANGTVSLMVNASTDITALSPVISVSNFASINPGSGVSRDFTNPVVYTVTAQDASTKQWTVTVTKQATGIAEAWLAEGIAVYPNPAKDAIQIDLRKFEGKVQHITLLDNLGRNMPITYDEASGTIDVSGFTEGIYLLQIESNKGVISKKILVQP